MEFDFDSGIKSVIVTDDHHFLKGVAYFDIDDAKNKLKGYLDKCPMEADPKIKITAKGFVYACRGIRKLLYKEKNAKRLKRPLDSNPSVDSCNNCEIKNKVDKCLNVDSKKPENILLEVKIININQLGDVPWVELIKLK